MSRIIHFFLLTIVVSALFSNKLEAQEWEIGGWIGVSNYFGDLNTSGNFEFIGPAGGVFARKTINTRFAYKFGFNYGSVAFEDASSKNSYQQIRNLSFRSTIIDFSNHIEFHFMKFDRRKSNLSFTPYLLAGISVFYFNPTTTLNGEKIALQPIGTEGQTLSDGDNKPYSKFNVAIPVGWGFKYSFHPYWTLGIEGGYYITFTDYLDDVSNEYSGNNYTGLEDRSGEVGDAIGFKGKQRGDALENDRYLFIGITISYALLKEQCPKISKIP